MSYLSIDTLQKALSEEVFSHTKDAKKAAGRALGTMIEIISFYLLREWGIERNISIERGLAEYGNPSITHNVEFTLHPCISDKQIRIPLDAAITANKIRKTLNLDKDLFKKEIQNTLLTKDRTLKNACVIAESESTILLAKIKEIAKSDITLEVFQQMKKPYAMFECKRVGVEEGNKKGPQTIEKAKQGAYVAKTTSSLQKIRDDQGNMCGLIFDNGNTIIKPYADMLQYLINGENETLLKDFTLSVGIVSNHGNWFTSQDQNKELKVLAQSYDWLLFLTDYGLAQFCTDLLLEPSQRYQVVRKAFLESYKEGKKSNVFTKVKMNYDAHLALIHYFHKNIAQIEKWFNVITPENTSIENLKKDLNTLNLKNWEGIL